MKTSSKFLFFLSFLFLLSSCDSDDDSGFTATMRAAVHSNCIDEINYVGDDLYAYELTDPDLGTYWQVGGHPAGAVNEMPDLGANIFGTDDGNYEVSDDWGIGQAFVYYIDENGNQYGSTANQLVTVDFQNESSPQSVTFGNIEMYSFGLDNYLCINNCTISYIAP